MSRLLLKEIFKETIIDTETTVKGWVRSVRKSKKFCFMVLNDGSCQNNLQIIIDAELANYDEASSLLAGSSVSITGLLVASGGKGQSVEMQAKSVEIIGKTDESYPLQKKGTSLEFLREKAHLRPRTNLFGAVFRVRHALSMATHKFFSDKGFYYVNTPIITAVDGEGAGEMFKVTMLDQNNLPRTDKGEIDYSKDYFGKDTSLAVTGQLEGECFASGMGAIYTFGPTFRSENSHTARHLSEFWMIEPEVAFADLDEIAELSVDYLKYLISYAIDNCKEELEFLTQFHKRTGDAEDHMGTITHVRDSEFIKITYTEAIDILQKCDKKFEYPTNWGDELQTEHERYLAERHFKLPVIVTDYPKDFKAFYMKQNDDGKTVRAMDVLVPGVGEIIGGSQREENLDKLVARMDADGMEKEGYWWYLELRKFGTVPHSGFGLGFERAVMYITGMKNIRDVIPFPRTPKSCDF
jgi:asparaginyl-tRNA synthetase